MTLRRDPLGGQPTNHNGTEVETPFQRLRPPPRSPIKRCVRQSDAMVRTIVQEAFVFAQCGANYVRVMGFVQ